MTADGAAQWAGRVFVRGPALLFEDLVSPFYFFDRMDVGLKH